MSTVLHDAQAKAMQKNRMTVAPIARPAGEAGVSTISSAAGRNSSSKSRRRTSGVWTTAMALSDFMEACL
jgi:hypothetical protein